MAFSVDDDEFQVDEATLTGILPDPYWCDTYNKGNGKAMFWYLTIKAKEQLIDGDLESPMLLHQNVPLVHQNWRSVGNDTFTWNASDDVDAHLYTFESDVVAVGELRFGKREGLNVPIRWQGETETFCSTFSVETQVIFTGIKVRGSERDTDGTTRARLASCFDISNLVQNDLRVEDFAYESGVRVAMSLFVPRP
ncbi:MAG: hypothetical protein KDB27_31035 [Planctomycetales bacterium]|nr:hypothetical protein [Planctomycetales bacterium]